MDIKELRIGNWVEFFMDEYNKWYVPALSLVMDENIDIFAPTINGTSDNTFQPIPLTDEILVRIGFTKTGRNWYLNQFGLIEINDKFFVYNHRLIEVPSVHKMQNLFHASNGVDLYIDLFTDEQRKTKQAQYYLSKLKQQNNEQDV